MKMLYYGRQTVEDDDIQAVVDALRSDRLTQGDRVRLFEELICHYTGANYAVVCSNGTAALYMAYRAAGLEPEATVLTTPVTFLSTVTAAIQLGAKPQFCDIDEDSLNIDTGAMEALLKGSSKPQLIVPVHFGGFVCDMERIGELARHSGAIVIEDACHAFGSSWRDSSGRWHRVGDCAFSAMTVFSFHPVKTITTCEGGAITTNDSTLYKRLLSLREHGIIRAHHSREHIGPWYYELGEPSFNFRLSDVHSALGISQIRKTERFVRRRQQIAAIYDRLFSGKPFIKTPPRDERIRSAYHLYPLRIDFDGLGMDKRRLFKLMEQEGIALQVHYIPLHMQPYIQRHYGFKQGDFPNSERFYREAISIPIYPLLSDEEASLVAERLLYALSAQAAL